MWSRSCRAEFRNLQTFATLSPIPGFRRWLDPQLAGSQRARLLATRRGDGLRRGDARRATGAAALAAILAKRGWWRDPALRKAAEPVLVRLCARYLLIEATAASGRAIRWRISICRTARGWSGSTCCGDTSEKGAKESATLMVNYLYDPARIEDWHEDYAGEGKRNASTAVRRWRAAWAVVGLPAWGRRA